jgi:hypothetical protein
MAGRKAEYSGAGAAPAALATRAGQAGGRRASHLGRQMGRPGQQGCLLLLPAGMSRARLARLGHRCARGCGGASKQIDVGAHGVGAWCSECRLRAAGAPCNDNGVGIFSLAAVSFYSALWRGARTAPCVTRGCLANPLRRPGRRARPRSSGHGAWGPWAAMRAPRGWKEGLHAAGRRACAWPHTRTVWRGGAGTHARGARGGRQPRRRRGGLGVKVGVSGTYAVRVRRRKGAPHGAGTH